jgi:hypothetical protein
MNSCDYKAEEPTKLAADEYTANVSVSCTTAGDKININATVFGSVCEVEIGAQGPIQHLILINETASKDVRLKVTLSGIKATILKDNGLCSLAGTGERNNVTTNGGFTAKATNEASAFVG